MRRLSVLLAIGLFVFGCSEDEGTQLATVQGHITNSSKPVEGATITLLTEYPSTIIKNAVTDKDGFYSIPDLEPGRYEIGVGKSFDNGASTQTGAKLDLKTGTFEKNFGLADPVALSINIQRDAEDNLVTLTWTNFTGQASNDYAVLETVSPAAEAGQIIYVGNETMIQTRRPHDYKGYCRVRVSSNAIVGGVVYVSVSNFVTIETSED